MNKKSLTTKVEKIVRHTGESTVETTPTRKKVDVTVPYTELEVLNFNYFSKPTRVEKRTRLLSFQNRMNGEVEGSI